MTYVGNSRWSSEERDGDDACAAEEDKISEEVDLKAGFLSEARKCFRAWRKLVPIA